MTFSIHVLWSYLNIQFRHRDISALTPFGYNEQSNSATLHELTASPMTTVLFEIKAWTLGKCSAPLGTFSG